MKQNQPAVVSEASARLEHRVKQCEEVCPPTWTAHWREFHRGHGCHLDPDALDVHRAVNEMRAISLLLSDAGIGPCTLAEGVRLLLARADAAESTLRRLRQEIAGCLGIAEHEIRDAIGNSNMAALKAKIKAADALLASSSPAGTAKE